MWYVLVATVGYSLMPLVIDWGKGGDNPFLFNAGWRYGFAAGCLLFLFVSHRRLLFSSSVWNRILPRIWVWAMVFAVISHFDSTFFTISLRFIDVSIAAILFETWPIVMVLLILFLFRRERRYEQNLSSTLPLMLMGFWGFSFVVSSQFGAFAWNRELMQLALGVVLAFLGAGVSSLGAFTFRWGADLSRVLTELGEEEEGDEFALDMFGVVVGQTIANLATAPLNIIIGLAWGESIAMQSIVISFVGGLLCNSAANICWRRANLVTTNLGVNAIAYATPLFSLIWLALFWHIAVARVDFLIIGSLAVVSANLLINFEAEVKFGFKALILALWGCGAFVYLRDDFLQYLPFDGWLWPRETYLGALGLSATVFILLLTFRVARLGPRTQDEDNRIFALHRSLELLARRHLIDPEVNEHIRGIDSAHNPQELRTAYAGAKLCFAQATAVDRPPADRKLLADAETQLNIIVHSRQQGVDFGELFSLIIFGGSTVLLSLLSRPEVYGWVAFLYEVFSVLFPAVIVFLIINVWDLHRERADLVLANLGNSREYGVIFRDTKNRRFERSVSTLVGLLIILAYVGLLWNKWLG